MSNDRDILRHALEPALQVWEEEGRGKSLLGQGPPSERVLSPLTDAIDQCAAYKAIAGHVLFTANSGPVLHAPSLALPLLYRAERAQRERQDIGQAADWLIRMLRTRHADGRFTAVIWGLSIYSESPLGEHARLVPFGELPDSRLKKSISDRARKLWNDAVWMSQSYFDLPGAAIVRKVANFPYIGTDGASFKTMSALAEEAYETLVFLQGKAAGQPLALGYWFEYDDDELDLNSYDNYISWILPEIVPSIPANATINAATAHQELKALSAMPADWRNDLTRSMERFTLSPCRHQTIDRILDLTLAFEIAVSGKGDQAPQSWKVSVRSAQMVGGPLGDRQENRRKMSELYGLRNKGTHGSSLSGGDPRKQEAVLTEAAALYRKLLDSFWRHGTRPDWAAIELGRRSHSGRRRRATSEGGIT
jgi:hypothetical protein